MIIVVRKDASLVGLSDNAQSDTCTVLLDMASFDLQHSACSVLT